MQIQMDILRVTPIIADMHESGLFATKHSRGEFETDKQRWFAAAADCGIVGDKRIAKCWKLYVKSCFIADEPHEENQGSPNIVVDAVNWVTMYCDLAEILAERDGVELTTVTDEEGNEAYTDDAGEAWLGYIEEAETILGRLGMNKQRS